jgi:hypothetical protein
MLCIVHEHRPVDCAPHAEDKWDFGQDWIQQLELAHGNTEVRQRFGLWRPGQRRTTVWRKKKLFLRQPFREGIQLLNDCPQVPKLAHTAWQQGRHDPETLSPSRRSFFVNISSEGKLHRSDPIPELV